MSIFTWLKKKLTHLETSQKKSSLAVPSKKEHYFIIISAMIVYTVLFFWLNRQLRTTSFPQEKIFSLSKKL